MKSALSASALAILTFGSAAPTQALPIMPRRIMLALIGWSPMKFVDNAVQTAFALPALQPGFSGKSVHVSKNRNNSAKRGLTK